MSTLAPLSVAQLCADTPMVDVRDNRGLSVRTLQYNRQAPADTADQLISQQRYGVLGELISRIDPRLFAEQQLNASVLPNFRYQCSLSGKVLFEQSQDAGDQAVLYDIENAPVWQEDSRAQTKRFAYDVLHRLSTVVEQDGPSAPERISERNVYGESEADATLANCRGQLMRNYDTAGLNAVPSYSCTGQPLLLVRQLLSVPLALTDWQGSEANWQTALASEAFSTQMGYNALGEVVKTVDARGNQQHQQFNIAGQLASSSLVLAGQGLEQPMLTSIRYSAAGQVLHEVAGNGVTSEYQYEPQTQRLNRLLTRRPASGSRNPLLEDLTYGYDPVGNILSIGNAAIPVSYHRNQRIEPANDYLYDALYQLLRASGRENATAGQQGQGLPVPQVPISADPNNYSNYTRLYTYDRGGNLTQIRHQGSANYTLDTVVSPSSNHAVQQSGHLLPSDVDAYFDTCGNLTQLVPGAQPLYWNGRNQLQQVVQVARTGGADDAEYYQYDGGGQRVLKTTLTQTSGGRQRSDEVIYLPGLELRRTRNITGGGNATTVEALQVIISVGNTGRQQLRILHSEHGGGADMLRFSLNNQIGSSVLELDKDANLLTLEEYFPYGGTSVWSGRSLSETKYKFVRYSGKELDATGLYYYGFRYYAPWLGRWLNPDPAGTVDGLNLYRMVNNNPIVFFDVDGLAPDTLVIFTQKRERLEGENGTILKVANSFFKENAARLIAPPIPREEMAERLASIGDLPESVNLILIGHGNYGYFNVGAKSTHNLNNLNLPQEVSEKVSHVSFMHCTAGKSIAKIGQATMKSPTAWTSLKTMSGNVFYNNWQSMGNVISRHGWEGDEGWKAQAQKLLDKEKEKGASDRKVDDLALKNQVTYNAETILSPEGFHRTYYVREDTARFSYRMPTRRTAGGAAAATGSSRDMLPTRGRTPAPPRGSTPARPARPPSPMRRPATSRPGARPAFR